MEGSSGEKQICEEEPLLATSDDAKGGFKTLPFIIANESLEKVASFGLLPNMTRYLMGEYGLEAVPTSNLLYLNSAASSFTPLFGALLADSYVGRYPMIGFGSVVSFLGMFLLWLTAIIPKARAKCDEISGLCDLPPTAQLLLLYSSLVLMAIGAGGIRASSLAFGADQLNNNKDERKNAVILESFIGWYYVSMLIAALIGMSFIVYIQDNMGWKLGFGVPVVLMFLSTASFFLASSIYVKLKPSSSLITDLVKVLVASFKKRDIQLSSMDSEEMYHHRAASTLLVPSRRLRFLNKACTIRNPSEELTTDGRASDPWSLCTVDQVEALKAVIKLIPMWSTGIIISVASSQNTIPYLQVASMDRHITPNFQIPAGSFSTFLFISLALWVTLYDRLLVPLASKIRGKPTRLGAKQKMGCGILLSCISLAVSAIVETNRRNLAIKEGSPNNPRDVVDMSAFWLLPRYVLSGMSEALNVIGQNEFYLSQLPTRMASIATNIAGLSMSIGNLVASFIMSTVDSATKAGGRESWVSGDINKGHYDYYYWLLCGLSILNFFYFVVCSRIYGPCEEEEEECKASTE